MHGAGGGSGLAAIEIGKRLGARIIATAGSEDKLAAAKEHGADLGINYRQTNFRDAVLDYTDGRGADVVFDPVGGDVFQQSLRCIAPDGRLIPMGFASGDIPNIPANIVLVKNVSVIGLYWGYYMGWGKHAPLPGTEERVRQAFDTMFGWLKEGALRPRTWHTYSIENFTDALTAIASRKVIGRVALTVHDA